MRNLLLIAILSSLVPVLSAEAARPKPPVRDPQEEGFVAAAELPDGELPPKGAVGNFVLGPKHPAAPEMLDPPGGLRGRVIEFTMKSADSRIYPGVARDAGTSGKVDPADPAKLIVTTSRSAPYERRVAVYIPKDYVAGMKAPFIVGADGPDKSLFTALDNLIAERRVPPLVAISIGNGGGDAQGSQRGLEYDTVSGLYAEFVEKEVLPRVEKECGITLTDDPNGRATTGCSSGASCAFTMAWFRPDLYRRVLSYSGTYVNQQWPSNPETPHGAWEYHERLIPNNPPKPLKIWLEVSDQDNYNPNRMRDGMHDWVLANERMAHVLAEKGYQYQFVFAKNAGHCDGAVKRQTLPYALEWLWSDYKPADDKSAE